MAVNGAELATDSAAPDMKEMQVCHDGCCVANLLNLIIPLGHGV